MEEHIFKNDFELSYPDQGDKEGFREAISKQFKSSSLDYELNSLSEEQEVQENPNIIRFESLDLFGTLSLNLDAPHFQQSRIENLYMLDEVCVFYPLFRMFGLILDKYKQKKVRRPSGSL